MQSLPEECVVHALCFLEPEDAIRFTRTTKDTAALVTKHDKILFRPALQRLSEWRQGTSPEPEGSALSCREWFLHERADLKRTAITQGDLVDYIWRLRFRERGHAGVQTRELPPRAVRFVPNGPFLLEGFPPMPWSVAEDGLSVVIANFPPHRVQRRAHYDHGWTLENENVILWSVESADAHPGSVGRRHALRANYSLEWGEFCLGDGSCPRVRGGPKMARIAFMDAVAHTGGTLASLPIGATGFVSEEETWERYQNDPGGEIVEMQERYQLETLWHERGARTRALIRLASTALETGHARQALDAARRASVNVVHNGDLIRRVEDLRARALLALSEEQEQPTTRPRSESLLARGLEGLGV